MTETATAIEQARASLAEKMKTGAWKPPPGDALHECDFLRAGFRSWALEASDRSWKLTLSKLDFGSREPSALLTVNAENHANAFPDLDWLVFTNSIGTNGGTNFNQCVARLSETLGGNKLDWARRVTYLIGRAKQSNAGNSNGTFSTREVPRLVAPAAFVFPGRLRTGRSISIFGPGSAGKTTLVDGLIVSACSGKEIIPGWVPTRRYTTMILDWDEGEDEETIRLSAICDAYGVQLEAGYHYKRQTRPLHDVADEVGAYVVANGVELCIVSPVGRAARNMGDNLTAPIDELYEVLRSFGTTNILIDHVTGDNMKGGAQREFGSVRKRDNVRGSWAVDVQSEEPGTRVLVVRNTKHEALAPGLPDQAIRIEYEPPWPKDDYTYDRISFHADEVDPQALADRRPISDQPMRVVLRDLLKNEKLTPEELADASGLPLASIKTCLYRYRDRWFGQVASGRWEILPGAH